MKQCKNIEEYHKFLNNTCPVYGPSPHRSMLDDFKRQEEEKKKEKRNQEKEDILKYEQYLRKKLETQRERLSINLENEGIQDFGIMFSNTLQKYPFLQGIMKHICPRFFEYELTKEDIELGKMYNEIEKEKAEKLMEFTILLQKKGKEWWRRFWILQRN